MAGEMSFFRAENWAGTVSNIRDGASSVFEMIHESCDVMGLAGIKLELETANFRPSGETSRLSAYSGRAGDDLLDETELACVSTFAEEGSAFPVATG